MRFEKQTFMATVRGEQLQVRLLTPLGSNKPVPTLVFLHEALGSIAQWRDFPEMLVEKCALPALIYDRCGFGNSQPLQSPRGLDYFDQEVLCLEALLKECDVDMAVLVGHSDGATLALLFAARFPERVCAIISEAAHLFVEEETLIGIRSVVERWKTSDMQHRLERYHGMKAEQVFWSWAKTWLDPAFRDWNIEATMSGVVCPVLAIQGQEDEFATVRQLDAICSSVSGYCRRCLIDDCGHVPHQQAQEDVLKEMSDFVTGLELGS